MDGIALEPMFFEFALEDPANDTVRIPETNQITLYQNLKEILIKAYINTVFQPIVSLADGSILGYEALSRGPHGSPLEYPDVLFDAARKLGRTWELESLCRAKALERAREILPEYRLFLNVDPKVIYDEKFRRGFTKELLGKYHLDPANIIFEITEKSSVEDYKSFKKVIDNYMDQGYKIAIDDAGAGYSGLNLVAEIRPQYLKIDMKLIRNIDKDSLRRNLVKTLYDFCIVSGIKIIAEGIETINELNTLIDIGIHYGQGYLIQRPLPLFNNISENIKKAIAERNKVKNLTYYHNSSTIAIGDVAKIEKAIAPNLSGGKLLELFNTNSDLFGIPVVENRKLLGLIMKDKFFTKLGTQYGIAIFMKRPIELLMDKNPLVVDFYTPLDKVSRLAMSRRENNLYDYVVVSKEGEYYGIVTVKDLVEKSTQLEINYAKHLNPLTGLPGNNLIEKYIHNLISSKQCYCVLYIDLDNFKSYNDVYGFESGDKLLQMTANILKEQSENFVKGDKFVGHIGGDDFVVVVKTYTVSELCRNIINTFDQRVKELYRKEDLERGYIISKNRHGQMEQFPLVSISLAGITNRYKKYSDTFELAKAAGDVKKRCKEIWKSCCNID